MELRVPIHVHWELTNKCNLKCLHCYQQGDREHCQLSREQLLTIAGRLTKARVFQVTLTGGEPFAIDCLMDIIEHLISYDIVTYITSNGSYIDDKTAKWLASRFIPVQISLDSHVPEKHDYIRGTKGAFRIAVTAMHTLLRNGVKTSLAFCANSFNYQDIEGVVLLAKDIGVRKILIGELIPVIGERINKNKLVFVNGQYLNFISNASDIRERYQSSVDVQINSEWGFVYDNTIEHTPCSALDRDMAILFSGDASPCPFIRNEAYFLGNLLEQNVESVWNSQPARRFRQHKQMGCDANCTFYSVCKSGCKAVLANNSKRIDRRDPRCPLK